ncbi:Alpha-mannosidase [Aphelenchoides bicaudatus]|nr:Alpha-mannosidase [Aphelenchoides bicaudatus]
MFVANLILEPPGQCAENVQELLQQHAKLLTDQYRQLSPYYQSKQLLIAIGDDFFFKEPRDFTENYKNYRQLIDHINTTPGYGMNIKFSTVSDYFEAIRAENKTFPLLRSDFFPYTENKEGSHPYWSGYFVHRPYFKRLERVVQGQLRRLDILRTLSGQRSRYDVFEENRRNLALVQHHDAITGTSKPHVTKDYTNRLITAEGRFRQLEADVLGGLDYVTFFDDPSRPLEFNEKTQLHRLVIFNQHTSTNPQRISILTNKPNVAVSLADGSLVEAQIFPYMNLPQWTQSDSIFEIIFYIRIPALGSRRISVSLTKGTSSATTLLLDNNTNSSLLSKENSAENLNGNPEAEGNDKNGFLVDCGNFTLRFDDNGLLQSFKRDDDGNEEIKLKMNYGFYADYGGAYVFAPNGHQKTATLKNNQPDPIVLIGPQTVRVLSELQFVEPAKYKLYQFIEIPRKQSSKSIEIRIELISSPVYLSGFTFVMNFETSIENGDSLFTDVNGLYLTKREMNDVAHAGNFYPAASSTLIEDHNERLTVLFGQPTGATTSRRGHLEFFVDRNVKGSDGKGLDYGDSATNETAHLKYRLIIEKRDVSHAHQTIYLSRHAHEALELLLHPSSVYQTRNAKNFPGFLWPCNVQLINIRHLRKPEGAVLLILRRLDFDCTVMDEPCVSGDNALLFNTLKQLFPNKRMRFTTLTGSHDDVEILSPDTLNERLKSFNILTIKYE